MAEAAGAVEKGVLQRVAARLRHRVLLHVLSVVVLVLVEAVGAAAEDGEHNGQFGPAASAGEGGASSSSHSVFHARRSEPDRIACADRRKVAYAAAAASAYVYHVLKPRSSPFFTRPAAARLATSRTRKKSAHARQAACRRLLRQRSSTPISRGVASAK